MTASPRIICFGEVLWDLFPEGKRLGGAPMNVAFHAGSLGLPAYLISAVGKDALGQELKAQLATSPVKLTYLQTLGLPTGVVDVDTSNPAEVRYHIAEPAAWDAIAPTPGLATLARQGDAVVFGTLAMRSNRNLESLQLLWDSSAMKVFDLNLRPPFIDRQTVALGLQVAQMIKVNKDEYRQLAYWFGFDQNPAVGYQKLKENWGCTHLVRTLGSEGSELYTPNGIFTTSAPKVEVADTVGAGDSFLASLLHGLLTGVDDQQALEHAAAVGSYVASQRGATPELPRELRNRFR